MKEITIPTRSFSVMSYMSFSQKYRGGAPSLTCDFSHGIFSSARYASASVRTKKYMQRHGKTQRPLKEVGACKSCVKHNTFNYMEN